MLSALGDLKGGLSCYMSKKSLQNNIGFEDWISNIDLPLF